MLVTILAQKYKTGCERGIAAEELPDILTKLNAVIEWDKCEFPKKKEGETEIEDRKFLGDTPELKPGDCFFYEGNVIAVDRDDRLILILSETGPGALHRICHDIILEEFYLFMNCTDVDSVEFKEVDPATIPEDYEEYPVSFYLMKIFREKVAYGRFNSDVCLECNVDFYIPLHMYIRNWSMFFNKEEIDDEIVDVAKKEILAWFYKKFERILPPKPEQPDTNISE